jgi:hypothetical protein
LASVLGTALIRHQVVQMGQPAQKRLLVTFGMMKRVPIAVPAGRG